MLGNFWERMFHLRTTASDFLLFIQLIWVNQFFLVLSVRWMCEFLLLSGSKKAMTQFQIALDTIPKIKPTRRTSEFQSDSIIQASKFIKKRLQHRYFLVINAPFLRTPTLKIIIERLLLKIYPILLFWILKWISEETTVCRRSSK